MCAEIHLGRFFGHRGRLEVGGVDFEPAHVRYETGRELLHRRVVRAHRIVVPLTFNRNPVLSAFQLRLKVAEVLGLGVVSRVQLRPLILAPWLVLNIR